MRDDEQIDLELLQAALCNFKTLEDLHQFNLITIHPIWLLTKVQLEVGLGHKTWNQAAEDAKAKIKNNVSDGDNNVSDIARPQP